MPLRLYFFFIGKIYNTHDYETTNVFNMRDHLLTIMIYIAIQTQKASGQWNLISSVGSPERLRVC